MCLVCTGESVPQNEWITLLNLADLPVTEGGTPSQTESMIMESSVVSSVPSTLGAVTLGGVPVGAIGGAVTDEERTKFELERAEMYRQMDEKVKLINNNQNYTNYLLRIYVIFLFYLNCFFCY